MKKSKQLWSVPWGYRESLLFVVGVVTTGFFLQLAIGEFDFFLLHRPVNYGLAGILLFLSWFLSSSKHKHICAWFGGVPLAVSLLTAMLFLTLLMGSIPQIAASGSYEHFWEKLGLAHVTHAWSFVFLYVLLLLSLGVACLRRTKKLSTRNSLFLLNHGGLWIALLAAGLGAADRQRHIMHVPVGEVEWRVYAANDDVLELPLAIRLHEFDIEEYPPKLAIIDRVEGTPLPEGKAEWLQLGTAQKTGKLGAWDITTESYLHQAVWAGNGTYRAMQMPGASPAVQITAKNRHTGVIRNGWVSGGNMMQFMSTLSLDDSHVVVMAQPEPKRFLSDISVATPSGEKKRALLEVNSPIRIGNWMIYQYGYDDKAGKLSSYSSFELVYDPWLPLVYIGLILMSAGACMLIWFGKKTGETV